MKGIASVVMTAFLSAGCGGAIKSPSAGGGTVPPPILAMPIYAPAPLWISPVYLGTPLDARFQPIANAGTTIFPGAPILGMPVDDFRHEKVEMQDSTSLDANISAWGGTVGVQGGVGMSSDYRYAAYRAYDVHFVSLVDERYPTMVAPPANAVWYPARIYWGHSYEVVCYGDAHSFTSELGAKFKIFSGSVSSFDGHNGVSCKIRGRGLSPNAPGAIYAGTDEEVRRSYHEDTAQLSPIFVEYRMIPGVPPPETKGIAWLAPYHVEVKFTKIHIGYQSNWFRVRYWAQASCDVNGQEDQDMAMRVVLNGDTGSDNEDISTRWMTSLSAVPGDRIACGLQGRFVGTARDGQMPQGVMAPVTISTPGEYPGTFVGKNGDTAYTVDYVVTVAQMQQ